MFLNGFKPIDQALQTTHEHDISGITSYDLNHDHNYAGVTSTSPNGPGHVHKFMLYTTTDDEHTHIIRGTTGRAIFLRNGSHYHLFSGVTSLDGNPLHTHQYSGQTNE